MEAAEVGLLEFFKLTLQVMVPDPERGYRWTEKECQQLWDDIIRIADDDSIPGHFIGTIVYIEYGILKRTVVPRLVLLDGQQRLVTVSLLMTALGKAGNDAGEKGEEQREISDQFLFNSQEKGDFYCKLLPARCSKEMFFSLISGEEMSQSASNRMIDNYRFFEKKIKECGMDIDLIYKGVEKLTIMNVSIDQTYENPKYVCEKLDSTGLDKAQTSLIRNWLSLIHSAS